MDTSINALPCDVLSLMMKELNFSDMKNLLQSSKELYTLKGDDSVSQTLTEGFQVEKQDFHEALYCVLAQCIFGNINIYNLSQSYQDHPTNKENTVYIFVNLKNEAGVRQCVVFKIDSKVQEKSLCFLESQKWQVYKKYYTAYTPSYLQLWDVYLRGQDEMETMEPEDENEVENEVESVYTQTKDVYESAEYTDNEQEYDDMTESSDFSDNQDPTDPTYRPDNEDTDDVSIVDSETGEYLDDTDHSSIGTNDDVVIDDIKDMEFDTSSNLLDHTLSDCRYWDQELFTVAFKQVSEGLKFKESCSLIEMGMVILPDNIYVGHNYPSQYEHFDAMCKKFVTDFGTCPSFWITTHKKCLNWVEVMKWANEKYTFPLDLGTL
jgi:hypothetical protein